MKFLECLFTLIFISSSQLSRDITINLKVFLFKKLMVNDIKTDFYQYFQRYMHYSPKLQKVKNTGINEEQPFI